jgi:hypothetical protein
MGRAMCDTSTSHGCWEAVSKRTSTPFRKYLAEMRIGVPALYHPKCRSPSRNDTKGLFAIVLTSPNPISNNTLLGPPRWCFRRHVVVSWSASRYLRGAPRSWTAIWGAHGNTVLIVVGAYSGQARSASLQGCGAGAGEGFSGRSPGLVDLPESRSYARRDRLTVFSRYPSAAAQRAGEML